MVKLYLQVSYLIVDEMHSEHPELIQDMYWDEVFPQELPYTIASEQFRREPPQGSTANIEVSEQDQEFLPMVEEEDEEIQDSLSGINVSENINMNLINRIHMCFVYTICHPLVEDMIHAVPPGLKVSRCAVVRHTRKRYTADTQGYAFEDTTFIPGYLQGDRISL